VTTCDYVSAKRIGEIRNKQKFDDFSNVVNRIANKL